MAGLPVRSSVGIALAFAVGACRSAPPPPSCPTSYVQDEGRTAKVLALLRGDPEARDLVDAPGPRAICWSPQAEGLVTSDGVLLLSSKESERDVAARAAHLLLHAREGTDPAVGASVCDEVGLGRIRGAEERAWALEGRVRGRLGLSERPSEAERVVAEYRSGCSANFSSDGGIP